MAEVYLDWKMKQIIIIIIIIIFILALGRSVHQNMAILFNGKEMGHEGIHSINNIILYISNQKVRSNAAK